MRYSYLIIFCESDIVLGTDKASTLKALKIKLGKTVLVHIIRFRYKSTKASSSTFSMNLN